MALRTQEEIMAKWSANAEPLVTIRCTTFKQQQYIAQCIEGFLIQETSFPFEIAIHEDASPDGTANVIRQYAEKYPKIIKTLFETENQYSKNDGSFTRIVNTMLTSKYVAMCEGDDYWTAPDKLQQQIDYLETHPECTMVVHRCETVNDRTGLSENQFPEFHEERDIPIEEIILGGGGLFGTNTMVYRRELLECTKEKYWDVSPVGDFPLILSAAAKGTVHYIPNTMAVYRIFANGSWSSTTLLGAKAFERRRAHVEGCRESLVYYDEYTEKKHSHIIREKIDLNDFNLYWDFGKWSLLKTTEHYKQRSLVGKLKAFYHCLRTNRK